jgi:hypothetical protein
VLRRRQPPPHQASCYLLASEHLEHPSGSFPQLLGLVQCLLKPFPRFVDPLAELIDPVAEAIGVPLRPMAGRWTVPADVIFAIVLVVFEVRHGHLELFCGTFGSLGHHFLRLRHRVGCLVGLVLCLTGAVFGPFGSRLGLVGRVLRLVRALLSLVSPVSGLVCAVASPIPLSAVRPVFGPVGFAFGPVGFALKLVSFPLRQVGSLLCPVGLLLRVARCRSCPVRANVGAGGAVASTVGGLERPDLVR